MININTKIKTIKGTIAALEDYEKSLPFNFTKRRDVHNVLLANKDLLDDFERQKHGMQYNQN